VIFGLQQGSLVLKEINKEMSLEAVEKLMDNTADAIAYQNVLLHGNETRLTGIGSIQSARFKGYE